MAASNQYRLTEIAISVDDQTVAVGFAGVPETGPGVILYSLKEGKQIGSLGADAVLGFAPSEQFAAWGNGVIGLAFSPDGSILYGVSNDDLFAWDTLTGRYLWVIEVPADPTHANDGPELIGFGHVSGFALSPDGKQLAAARGPIRVTSAGPSQPKHFIRRGGSDTAEPVLASGPVFSADSSILAATYEQIPQGKGDLHGTLTYWVGSNPHGLSSPGCQTWLSWTNQPDIFVCQDATGAHLRNIHAPAKDIGLAAPKSDLPLLNTGKFTLVCRL